MRQTVISCVGLSKQYRLGASRARYATLRDSISSAAGRSYGRLRSLVSRRGRNVGDEPRSFWALNDLSLEIERGEVVALIGRNGAGKSTLLKILSRITEPTRGYADITGRVGALLEVGTGFHPELTGRENIFLNGSILGMRRGEIIRQFDEIVSFAEVEQFIDTPVKHYSSGMYLRLAFSVAAHLEPEILLVDEVLAVGDAAFQKKCLGKMDDVAQQGRTVLFVSHNLGAVQELCHRGVLLEAGRIAFDGPPAECIGEYMRRLDAAPTLVLESSSPLLPGQPRLEASREGSGVDSGEPFAVALPFQAKKVRNPWIYFQMEDFTGRSILHKRILSIDAGAETLDGQYLISIKFPPLWLSPGVYTGQFKFLIPGSREGSGLGTGRVLSEKFMIEVHGEIEATGKAALHPRTEWKVKCLSK